MSPALPKEGDEIAKGGRKGWVSPALPREGDGAVKGGILSKVL